MQCVGDSNSNNNDKGGQLISAHFDGPADESETDVQRRDSAIDETQNHEFEGTDEDSPKEERREGDEGEGEGEEFPALFECGDVLTDVFSFLFPQDQHELRATCRQATRWFDVAADTYNMIPIFVSGCGVATRDVLELDDDESVLDAGNFDDLTVRTDLPNNTADSATNPRIVPLYDPRFAPSTKPAATSDTPSSPSWLFAPVQLYCESLPATSTKHLIHTLCDVRVGSIFVNLRCLNNTLEDLPEKTRSYDSRRDHLREAMRSASTDSNGNIGCVAAVAPLPVSFRQFVAKLKSYSSIGGSDGTGIDASAGPDQSHLSPFENARGLLPVILTKPPSDIALERARFYYEYAAEALAYETSAVYGGGEALPVEFDSMSGNDDERARKFAALEEVFQKDPIVRGQLPVIRQRFHHLTNNTCNGPADANKSSSFTFLSKNSWSAVATYSVPNLSQRQYFAAKDYCFGLHYVCVSRLIAQGPYPTNSQRTETLGFPLPPEERLLNLRDSFFQGINARSVVFVEPQRVGGIGKHFLANSGISVAVFDGMLNVNSVGDSFLRECSNLRYVNLGGLGGAAKTIPSAFDSRGVPSYTLYNCQLLRRVVFPMSYTHRDLVKRSCGNYWAMPMNEEDGEGAGAHEGDGNAKEDTDETKNKTSTFCNVLEVGDSVMESCPSLVSIEMRGLAAVETIGNGFLCGAKSLKRFAPAFAANAPLFTSIKSTTTCMEGAAISILGSDQSIVVYSVASIGDRFLMNCTALTTVSFCYFGRWLQRVGTCWMSGCESLRPVDLNNNVESVHDACSVGLTFEGLTNLMIVGGMWMGRCEQLGPVLNLGPLISLRIIGPRSLCNTPSLESVIMPGGTDYQDAEERDMVRLRDRANGFGAGTRVPIIKFDSSKWVDEMVLRPSAITREFDTSTLESISLPTLFNLNIKEFVMYKRNMMCSELGDFSFSNSGLTGVLIFDSIRSAFIAKVQVIGDGCFSSSPHLEGIIFSGPACTPRANSIVRESTDNSASLTRIGPKFASNCPALRFVIMADCRALSSLGYEFLADCTRLELLLFAPLHREYSPQKRSVLEDSDSRGAIVVGRDCLFKSGGMGSIGGERGKEDLSAPRPIVILSSHTFRNRKVPDVFERPEYAPHFVLGSKSARESIANDPDFASECVIHVPASGGVERLKLLPSQAQTCESIKNLLRTGVSPCGDTDWVTSLFGSQEGNLRSGEVLHLSSHGVDRWGFYYDYSQIATNSGQEETANSKPDPKDSTKSCTDGICASQQGSSESATQDNSKGGKRKKCCTVM